MEIESDSDKFSATSSEHEWSENENSENISNSDPVRIKPAKLSREAKELIEDSKFVLRNINCRR